MTNTTRLARCLFGTAATMLALGLATGATAAPVITTVGSSFASGAISFSLGNSATFTFTGTGDIFAPAAISSSGTGAINTVFGQPTSYFVNRGTVVIGPSMQYAAFARPTTVSYSNGDNFFGLRATVDGNDYFGFAYTTNTVLNSYGFESVPGRAITATTATGAVPEPATWATMICGFGLVGGTLRQRRGRPAVA